MIFKRDPIAMASQNWHFDDPVITSASYSEGVEPELTIAGNQPLLATFADEGRTITVMPAPALAPPPTTGSSALPSPEPAQSTATSVAVPAPASIPTSSGGSPAAREHYLIVLDASHGGDEPGAALSQKLAEKDVTLTIARRVRTQLQERGLATLMVRDADATLPLDDRAALANTSQAAVYIAIHAGGLGQGVHVYTSLLAPADPAIFVPWDQAQAAFVRSSRILASAVNDELGKNRLRAPLALQPAPLRPLNNITAAAIAVEVGPPGEPIETLNNSDYQDSVAKALAAALVTVRPRIEASR
jgi:N-acetylmuramoyl-L-alanine amidase